MFEQLALASGMVVAIVLVHLIGLGILTRALRSHRRLLGALGIMPLTLLAGATLGVVAIHTAEIWLYAVLYLGLHAFSNFETSLYFSTMSYAAIGYGDIVIPDKWRILGAIEGAVGIIMFGWSTAFLVSLLTRLNLLSHAWLQSDGISRRSRVDHAPSKGELR